MFTCVGNKLYINADKIEVIAIYGHKTENGRELGIVVNGQPYAIYTIQGEPKDEVVKELEDNIVKMIHDIVSNTDIEIKSIEIPAIDLSKYYEQKEKEIKKETIND